jgi:hypothetical protein
MHEQEDRRIRRLGLKAKYGLLISGHLQSAKSQVPSTKSQRTTNLQLPNFTAIGQLGLGTALELGIWSLGFDTPETTDTVN